MPIEVELPDGSVAEFPDDMKPDAIQGVLAQHFPAPPKPDAEGFTPKQRSAQTMAEQRNPRAAMVSPGFPVGQRIVQYDVTASNRNRAIEQTEAKRYPRSEMVAPSGEMVPAPEEQRSPLAQAVAAPAQAVGNIGKGALNLVEQGAFNVTGQGEEAEKILGGDMQPYEEGVKLLPPVWQAVTRGAQGLLETGPKLAATLASGPAAPATAGYLFGYDDKGEFHPDQAAIAAALPRVSGMGGKIAQTLASKLKIAGEQALSLVNAGGRVVTANAILAAQTLPGWSDMTTDQKAETVGNMIAQGFTSLADFHGVKGKGESGKVDLTKGSEIFKQAAQRAQEGIAKLAAGTAEAPPAERRLPLKGGETMKMPPGGLPLPKPLPSAVDVNAEDFNPPMPGPSGKKFAQPVEVPETPAEPYETVLATIRKAGANTTRKVQELFPHMEYSREQAADLRRQAFPDIVAPKPLEPLAERARAIVPPEVSAAEKVLPRAAEAKAAASQPSNEATSGGESDTAQQAGNAHAAQSLEQENAGGSREWRKQQALKSGKTVEQFYAEEKATLDSNKVKFRNGLNAGDVLEVSGDEININPDGTRNRYNKVKRFEVQFEPRTGRIIAVPEHGGPDIDLEPDSGDHFFNQLNAPMSGGEILGRKLKVIKGGEKNASEKQQATKVHGDMRPQPQVSEGEMPVQTGGGGIQPRPKAKTGEVLLKPSTDKAKDVAEYERLTAERVKAENEGAGIAKKLELADKLEAITKKYGGQAPNAETRKSGMERAEEVGAHEVTKPPETATKPAVSETPALEAHLADPKTFQGKDWTKESYQYATEIHGGDPAKLEELKRLEKQYSEQMKAVPKTLENLGKIGEIGYRKQWVSEAIKFNNALDEATATKASTDEELAAIARKHGVGAGRGGDVEAYAKDLKEGLAAKAANSKANEPPATGFKTSKGSVYTIDENGNTTRLKKSEGRGQGEVHEARPVVFLDAKGHQTVLEAGQSGARLLLADFKDGKFHIQRPKSGESIKNLKNPHVVGVNRQTGKVTDIAKASHNPTVEAHPFEIGYSGETKDIHLGNAITELHSKPKEVIPSVEAQKEKENAGVLKPEQPAGVAEPAPAGIISRLAADRPIKEPYSDKYSVSVQVGTTDPSQFTHEKVVASLPEELRGSVESVRRFQGEVVPTNAKASVPSRVEMTFKDQASAQKAIDYLKGLEKEQPKQLSEPPKGGTPNPEQEQARKTKQEGAAIAAKQQVTMPLGPGAATRPGATIATDIGQFESNIPPLEKLADAVKRFPKQAGGGFQEKLKQWLDDVGLPAKDLFGRAITTAKAMTARVVDALTSLPKVTSMDRAVGRWNLEDTEGDIAARRFSDAVKKQFPDRSKLRALSNWINAGGDRDLLARQAKLTKDPALKKTYEDALKFGPEEEKLAREVRQYHDEMLATAMRAGALEEGVEDYIHRYYPREADPTRKKLEQALNTYRFTKNFAGFKRRFYDSDFEAEQAGLKPEKDAAKRILAYDQGFRKALTARAFVKDRYSAKMPDGRPEIDVVGAGVPSKANAETGKETPYLIKPKSKAGGDAPEDYRGDYISFDHPAFRKWKWVGQDADGKPIMLEGEMAVHPDAVKKYKALFERSWFQKNPLGRALLAPSNFVKQTMLAISAFHPVQIGIHAIEHKTNPFNLVDLNVRDPAQGQLVEGGLVVSDLGGANHFSEGVAGSGLFGKIPIAGEMVKTSQDWLFKDFIPRIKMTMALDALERNRKTYSKDVASGKITDEQLVRLTAREANAAFGEQNYRAMFRNKSFQDLLRFVFLAPDFGEARLRFPAQALTKYGGEQRMALMLGALGMFVMAKTAEKLLTGHMNLSPSKLFTVQYHDREYGLRNVASDLMHMITDPAGYLRNRLNPVYSRAALEMLSGRDAFGRKRDAKQQVLDEAKQIIPISVRGLVEKDQKLWESFINAIGLTEHRRSSFTDEMKSVNAWKEKKGYTNPGEFVYDQDKDPYASLTRQLTYGNEGDVRKELDKLTAGKTPAEGRKVAEHYRRSLAQHPFLTGSRAHEAEYVKTLTGSDLVRYNDAKSERKAMWQKFVKAYRSKYPQKPE